MKFKISALLITLLLLNYSCSSPKEKKLATVYENNQDFFNTTSITYSYIKEIGSSFAVFPKVYPPDNCSMLIAKNTVWNVTDKQDVLDIGAGTGILGLVAAQKGAKHVVLTDINPDAIKNILHNAEILKLNDKIDVRLVTEETGTGAFDVIKDIEKFDLILFNPPNRDGYPKDLAEMALYDENYTFLKSFFSKTSMHLKEGGVIILGYNIVNPILERLAKENSFKISLIDELDKEDCKVFMIIK